MKKGFTLIELLSILVILAVIGLIATLIVLNIIIASEKGSFKETVHNVINAGKTYQMTQIMHKKTGCKTFDFSSNRTVEETINDIEYAPLKDLNLNGKLPIEGIMEVCSNNITAYVGNGKYTGELIENDEIVIRDGRVNDSDQISPTISNIYIGEERDTFLTETLTLLSNEETPSFTSSNVLNFNTETKYVISFDYVSETGTNEFSVDLLQTDFPTQHIVATTTEQHYNWVFSISNENIETAKIRFIDNANEDESDITITNIKMYELLTVSNSESDSKIVYIDGANDNESGLSSTPYSYDGGQTWGSSNYKIYKSDANEIVVKIKDNADNEYISPVINIINTGPSIWSVGSTSFAEGPWSYKHSIENITFLNSIPTDISEAYINGTNSKIWDVSGKQNGSILGYLLDADRDSKYELYFATNGGKMYLPSDSSYFFYYMINLSSIDFDNIYVSRVTNMNYMFSYAGYASMTTLDLGSNFDTTNVLYMDHMFEYAGFSALQVLDLGDQFDTSNVTNMSYMFSHIGYSSPITSIDLGNNFNTTNVTDMSYMFYYTGYNAMQTLNLGNNFNTSHVNNMKYMFYQAGYKLMESLYLGNSFNTVNVTNMNYMFYQTGRTSMITLDLGAWGDVTNLQTKTSLFNYCGKINEVNIYVKDESIKSYILGLNSSSKPSFWSNDNVFVR